MGILREPETIVWEDTDWLLEEGSYEQRGEVVPAHLTAFGEKINKVLQFFGIPEVEAK
jgi:hypothetical protein